MRTMPCHYGVIVNRRPPKLHCEARPSASRSHAAGSDVAIHEYLSTLPCIATASGLAILGELVFRNAAGNSGRSVAIPGLLRSRNRLRRRWPLIGSMWSTIFPCDDRVRSCADGKMRKQRNSCQFVPAPAAKESCES